MTNEDMLVSIWPSIRMMPTFPTPPQRLAQYTWPSLVSWSCKSFQINQRTGYRVRAVVQDTKYIPLSFSSPSPLGGGYKPQIWWGMPLEGYDICTNPMKSLDLMRPQMLSSPFTKSQYQASVTQSKWQRVSISTSEAGAMDTHSDHYKRIHL
jgi:hypothetical protein